MQTLGNITKSISLDQILIDIKIMNDIKIPKRIKNFGKQVLFEPNNYQQYFSFDNKDIAYTLAGFFGIIRDDNIDFKFRANLFFSE